MKAIFSPINRPYNSSICTRYTLLPSYGLLNVNLTHLLHVQPSVQRVLSGSSEHLKEENLGRAAHSQSNIASLNFLRNNNRNLAHKSLSVMSQPANSRRNLTRFTSSSPHGPSTCPSTLLQYVRITLEALNGSLAVVGAR